jgi:sugar O-acyltransferase (sialic acid O-acetyltransferase NeuD family)
MKDLIIIGAGSFSGEIAWLVEEINTAKMEWNLLGFIDDNKDMSGKDVNGYKVLGNIEYLKTLSDNIYVAIAIGDGNIRKNIIETINNKKFATLIHPNATYSKLCTIGEGSIICGNNILTVNVEIGKHVIINMSCSIGHDNKIKDYVTILPGTNISGSVTIGEFSILGTGTKVIQEIKIGKNVTVAAGTVVFRDIKDNCIAIGNPAKTILKN